MMMQASPEHLLSAAIMSAPAALAMAKLSYPETEESHTKTQEDVYIENLYVHSSLLCDLWPFYPIKGVSYSREEYTLCSDKKDTLYFAENPH